MADTGGGGGFGGGGGGFGGGGGGFGRGFRRGRGGPRGEGGDREGGGEGRGFRGRGRGRGGRGARGGGRGARGGRGGGRGGGGRGGYGEKEEEWKPITKLGRLVKDGKFPTLESIFQHSIKIKEPEIVDLFFDKEAKPLKDEIMKIKPVQKQTSAGQRTRFKAWVAIGDFKGHVGLGQKCAAEVGIAIRGAHTLAKLSIIPVRKGYWGSKLGDPHTVPCKVTGKCGSARVRLIPAPRGTGLVAAAVTKKLLNMAGIEDVYCKSKGQTRTTGNFVTACFLALRKTYKVLSPDLWTPTRLTLNPLDKYSVKIEKK